MRLKKEKSVEKFTYEKTKTREKFTKIDWIYLSIVVILFSIFAFSHLGTTKMANTYWKPDMSGDAVILDIKDAEIDAIYYLVGVGNDPYGNVADLKDVNFEIEASADLINWKPVSLINDISMYSWTEIPVSIIGNRYIRIRGYNTSVVMNEIGLK